MSEIIKVKIERSSIRENDNPYGGLIHYIAGNIQRNEDGSYNRAVCPVWTLPGPKHYFKYESTIITCPDCKSKFGHVEVKDIVDNFGDYDTYSYYACPNCSKCLDIIFEFEKISDVLKESVEE